MSRANNGGWDFVKVGETYQYKEDGWIAMVTILEDNSTEEQYAFKLKIEKSTIEPQEGEFGEFDISHAKGLSGYYSGMMQLYEAPEYVCDYKWKRDKTNKTI